MVFGIEFTPRNYDASFKRDLYSNRACWSGDVLYDFAFYLCNKHIFIGPLFSHPAHPFEKWERVLVLAIVVCLVIFPVAALSSHLGQFGLTRAVLVAVVATIPRNILKFYLISLSQQDSALELEEGHAEDAPSVRQARHIEYAVFAGVIVVTIVVCVVCSIAIKRKSN